MDCGLNSSVASYEMYLLTLDGDVLRAFELDCANDEGAVREAIRLRDTDVVEIEIWERTRFVGWLPVPPQLQTGMIWENIARLITLVAMSAGVARLAGPSSSGRSRRFHCHKRREGAMARSHCVNRPRRLFRHQSVAAP
jgi:hypothetical protein